MIQGRKTAVPLVACIGLLAIILFISDYTFTEGEGFVRTGLVKTPPPSSRNNKVRRFQSQSCHRKCANRNNIIYFEDKHAGLEDRKFIIRDLAEIAGYLCAHLVLPPPALLLHPKHNAHEPVSHDNTWSDYFNITFAEDDVPVIRNDVSIDDIRDGLHGGWYHVVSPDRQLKEDFQSIHKFTWEHQSNSMEGFVWEIHKIYKSDLWEKGRLADLGPEVSKIEDYRKESLPFYHKSIDFKKRNTITEKEIENLDNEGYGCMYTNLNAVPDHVQTLQKQLVTDVKRHSLKNSSQVLLHLRRGDAIDKCDNSVETIKKYLNCSFYGMEEKGMNFTVLMTTDDTDSDYRNSILDLDKDYSFVKILDADLMTTKIVNNAIETKFIDQGLDNNYYVFEVESKLREYGFVKYHFTRRRKQCHKCVPLASMIEQQNLPPNVLDKRRD